METKIKTYEDACRLLKRNPKSLPIVSDIAPKHKKYIVANYKLVIITEALNKEYSQNNGLKKTWQPDYTDSSQYKYYPWFEVKADKNTPSGFGFSAAGYGNWLTSTRVCSRLCFPTPELAIYSAQQFEKLHIENQLM